MTDLNKYIQHPIRVISLQDCRKMLEAGAERLVISIPPTKRSQLAELAKEFHCRVRTQSITVDKWKRELCSDAIIERREDYSNSQNLTR